MFLKFSEKQYLDEFVEAGRLYINSIDYYVRADSARFDKYEMAGSYHQPEGASVTLNGHVYKVASPFITNWDREKYSHIYSLFALTESSIGIASEGQVFDAKLWEFGDYVVLIHNVPEFLNRVSVALKARGFGYKFDIVGYYDSMSYDGKVGSFRKRDIYAYQCEYRLAILAHDYTDKAIEDFYIGSIKDITQGPVHRDKSVNRVVGDTAHL